MKDLKNILCEDKSVYFAKFVCSSYLPNWRDVDYTKNYSAKKELGGGVLLDLSHELDLAFYFFDNLKLLYSQNLKISELKINSDDFAFLALKSKKKLIHIRLDYFSKFVKREIVFCSKEKSYKVDLILNQLFIFDKNGLIEEKKYENDTINTLKNMHKAILKKDENLCTLNEAFKVLKLCDKVKMDNILCTICARGGSKGVKNKNIKKINDLELIAYSIIQAKNSKLFKHIVISTDSDEIAQVALKYGGEVFFKRDENLAKDDSAKLPVIKDALLRSEEYFNTKFDTIIDLDASAPLRNSKNICKAYELFKQEKKSNLITATPARRNPYFNLIEVDNDEVKKSKEGNFTTRQSAPKCYDMNASIYIFTREKLLKNDTLFGKDTSLYIMDEKTAFDIDSEFDFEIVEFLIKKANLKQEDF